ncbi:hypothetical protein LTR37_011806 [Vermiconidia calcicola]|uniref:Uncharacterized protein n=1 Tax=Vermiconidia calcicola TaxID=1690605 RepID=A0ACC3N1V7_9PEZI|nr:hypothetical protein LTR37_011806 [Vermiconidia calcicola]
MLLEADGFQYMLCAQGYFCSDPVRDDMLTGFGYFGSYKEKGLSVRILDHLRYTSTSLNENLSEGFAWAAYCLEYPVFEGARTWHCPDSYMLANIRTLSLYFLARANELRPIRETLEDSWNNYNDSVSEWNLVVEATHQCRGEDLNTLIRLHCTVAYVKDQLRDLDGPVPPKPNEVVARFIDNPCTPCLRSLLADIAKPRTHGADFIPDQSTGVTGQSLKTFAAALEHDKHWKLLMSVFEPTIQTTSTWRQERGSNIDLADVTSPVAILANLFIGLHPWWHTLNCGRAVLLQLKDTVEWKVKADVRRLQSGVGEWADHVLPGFPTFLEKMQADARAQAPTVVVIRASSSSSVANTHQPHSEGHEDQDYKGQHGEDQGCGNNPDSSTDDVESQKGDDEFDWLHEMLRLRQLMEELLPLLENGIFELPENPVAAALNSVEADWMVVLE